MKIFIFFPCGLAGKKSACNVGDLGLIPGLGRSPEKGKATHCRTVAWRIPWTVYMAHGVAESRARLSDLHFQVGHSECLAWTGVCQQVFVA